MATISDKQIKNDMFNTYSYGSFLDVCFISQGIVYDERNLTPWNKIVRNRIFEIQNQPPPRVYN